MIKYTDEIFLSVPLTYEEENPSKAILERDSSNLGTTTDQGLVLPPAQS